MRVEPRALARGLAASVWALCDGERTSEQIAFELRAAVALVEQALEELERASCCRAPPPEYGISRRQAARRLAQIGAGAFAAPLIYSIAISRLRQPPGSPCAASNCAPGTIIACGTGTGQCSASPDGIAVSSACSSFGGTCYRGGSNNTCDLHLRPRLRGRGGHVSQLRRVLRGLRGRHVHVEFS